MKSLENGFAIPPAMSSSPESCVPSSQTNNRTTSQWVKEILCPSTNTTTYTHSNTVKEIRTLISHCID